MSAIILTTKLYEPAVSESYESVGVSPSNEVSATTDFRAVTSENDTVFLEAYYLLKPDKRPSDTGETQEQVISDLQHPDTPPEIDTGTQTANTTSE